MINFLNNFILYKNSLGLKGLFFNPTIYRFKSIEFLIKKNGIEHPFILRLPSSDVNAFNQIFIQEEYNFDVKYDPKIIIDAGANIGLTSIYFANRYPNAKIISIEPEESNLNVLERNIAPYKNIHIEKAGLWGENCNIKVVDPGLGKWGFKTVSDDSEINKKIICNEIQGITIDRLMELHNLDYIDILKIDIEGAELEVFSNARAWIDRVGAIIIELHERLKPGCNRKFYNETKDFDLEWQQGENIYILRKESCLVRK